MNKKNYIQLELDEYQASNLANLLNLVSSKEPFVFANSGDWVAEISAILEENKNFYEDYNPNDVDYDSIHRWAIAYSIINE